MGRIIRKDAAAESIFEAARTTVTNATAKGGAWESRATERLGATLALVERISAQRAAVARELDGHWAAIEAEDDKADAVIGRVSDDVWNDVGRPAADPVLTVFFPGGVEAYSEGDVDEQPMRMELLATLLESGLHPRLAKEKGAEYAARVREAATPLAAVVERAHKPAAQLALYDKVLDALARVTQGELTKLKRGWQSEGFSGPEIHAVIPSVPKKAKRAEKEPAKEERKPSPSPEPAPAPVPEGEAKK